MMNADSSAQCNQKDFYNAYTQADQLPHSLTSSRAHTPSLQEIFDMNGLNMHSNSQNVGMDVLDNLMANTPSNSNGSSSMPAPAVTGPQPSQQALIEQQMKLNQLQQLYQLQTQIFQQQVSALISLLRRAKICSVNPLLRGIITDSFRLVLAID